MPPDAVATTDTGTSQTTVDVSAAPAAQPAVATPTTVTEPVVAAPDNTSLLGATDTAIVTTDGTQTAPATPVDAPKPADPATPVGAPETYEFKGRDEAVMPESDVAAFAVVAKELGLPQESAQKVLDSIIPVIAERYAKATHDSVTAYRADLVAQVKADKEIGGDKLAENLAIADKAVKAYGSPELRKLFNETGLGDHPAVIRAFYKMGQDISNATFVTGGKAPTKGETDAATKLYGSK